MDRVAEALAEKAQALEFDVVAGIPYTAVPLAALMAVKLGKPLVIPRKERKAYGTGGNIMGNFSQGQTCLVVDDLITTGGSKIETARVLEAEGLKVKDFLVILDRRGETEEDELAREGFNLLTLYTLNEVLAGLKEENLLSEQRETEIRSFLDEGQAKAAKTAAAKPPKPPIPWPGGSLI